MSNWQGWRWMVGGALLLTAWGVVGVRSLYTPEAGEAIITHGPQGEAPSLVLDGNRVSYGLSLRNGVWRSSQGDRGQAVVICFWAPWCDPCQALLSWLERYQQTLTGAPVTVLAVGVETDAQSLQASNLQLPMALLPESAAEGKNLVNRLPLLWLVSPEGQLLWQGEGYGNRLKLAREVSRCLKNVANTGGAAGTRP